MGTTAHIVTVGARDGLHERIHDRLRDLERRWTRFSQDSELSRLNASAGSTTIVETDTFRLIASAVEGWHRTAGRYDPTVAAAMAANGYDRTFEDVKAQTSVTTQPAPGCAEIVLIPVTNTVRLPHGLELDFGGIGKGFSADLICEEVLEAGDATGICVNIGGDARVAGDAPTPSGWTIDLAPTAVDGAAPIRVALSDGAVCTSRIDRRSWDGPEGRLHHVLDPATGKPTDTNMDAISVVAGSAAVAELITKAAIVSGISEAPRFVEEFDAGAVCVSSHGKLVNMGNIAEFVL
jgi:thiamine biosynthesis lipoprotein